MVLRITIYILLFAAIFFLIKVGWTESSGNPRLPLGIITWPLSGFLTILLVTHIFIKKWLRSFFITLPLYLALGIVVEGSFGDFFRGLAPWWYPILVWPIRILGLFYEF